MSLNTRQLPLLDNNSGCSCCTPVPSTAPATHPGSTTKETTMTTQNYSVTGMTCGHCANAVTSELTELDEVTDVSVDLVPGGTSTVTVVSDRPLEEARVVAALDEAGDYQLAE
jgi:copper chaperone